MKNILVGLLLALVSVPTWAASVTALTADQIELLNNHAGPVNRQIQIGTVLSNTQAAANGAFNLTNGKILVGNGSGVAAAVTPSGDVTISNAGVTAIGAAKVVESMVAPMDGVNAGLNFKRTAHLVWDPSAVASHRTGTAVAFGAGYGAAIPANSLITKVYYYTKTAVVSTSNDGTIAFNCLSAGDLQAAVDPDATWGLADGMGSGTITGIQVAGTSLVGLVVKAGCTPTLTVAVHNFTAGRVHIYIDYVTFN